MAEYITHILDTRVHDKKISLCKRDLQMIFHFVDVDHAFNAYRSGSRLLPCKKCMKVVKRWLQWLEE